MTATVSVIFVNYHCEALIERSIMALLETPTIASLEILVVDNGSSVDASFWSRLPARILPCIGNVGFGIACNRGAALARGEYLLFLNPDTIPKAGLVDSLVEHLSSHPEASACGPALTDTAGQPQIYWNFHHLLSWELAESLYLQGAWRSLYQNRMLRRLGPMRPWPTTFLSGACLFLRREVFQRANGFDARFFMNFEDFELGRRLERQGELHYLPFVSLVHEEGTTQRSNWANFVFQRLNAHRTFIDIYFHGWRWLAARIILLQAICLRIFIGAVFFRAQARSRLSGYRKALHSALREKTT